MTFCSSRDVPRSGSVLVCRESRATGTVGRLLLAAVLVAAPVGWYLVDAPTWVWIVCGLAALLVVPPTLSGITKLWSAGNWVLVFDGLHLWLNLRSAFNPGPPDSNHVLRIDVQEIVGVGPFELLFQVPGGGATAGSTRGSTRRKLRALDLIVPRIPDELADILKAERQRVATRRVLGVTVRSRVGDEPVTLHEDSVIRIAWRDRGRGRHITPSRKQALRALEPSIPVLPPRRQAYGDWRDLDDQQLEALVDRLLKMGDEMSATALLQRRGGLSTTEAVAEVRRRRGKTQDGTQPVAAASRMRQ